MKKFFLILTLFLVFATYSKELVGKVIKVSDGDTIIHLRGEWDIHLDEEVLGK